MANPNPASTPSSVFVPPQAAFQVSEKVVSLAASSQLKVYAGCYPNDVYCIPLNGGKLAKLETINWAYDVRLSADESKLVAATRSNQLRVWQLTDKGGDLLANQPTGDPSESACFASSGLHTYHQICDGQVVKSDPFREKHDGPTRQLHVFETPSSRVHHCVCTAAYLFVAGDEGKGREGIVYVYDNTNNNLVCRLKAPYCSEKSYSLRGVRIACHPDGTRLAASMPDGNVYEFDLTNIQAEDKQADEEPMAPVRTFTSLAGAGLTACAYTPSGQSLVASSAAGVVLQWNLTGDHDSPVVTPAATYIGGGAEGVAMSCVTTTRNLVVAGDEAGKVYVWRDVFTRPEASDFPQAVDVQHMLKKKKALPGVAGGSKK